MEKPLQSLPFKLLVLVCHGKTKYLSSFEKHPTTKWKNFIRKNQQLTKLKTQFLWHTLRTTGAMHGTSGFFSLIWRSHPKAPHMAQSSEKFRRSLPYHRFQSCFSVVVAYIYKKLLATTSKANETDSTSIFMTFFIKANAALFWIKPI